MYKKWSQVQNVETFNIHHIVVLNVRQTFGLFKRTTQIIQVRNKQNLFNLNWLFYNNNNIINVTLSRESSILFLTFTFGCGLIY